VSWPQTGGGRLPFAGIDPFCLVTMSDVLPVRSDRCVAHGHQRERLMAGQAGLLDLSAGSELLLGGTGWTVAAVEAQRGRVLLK